MISTAANIALGITIIVISIVALARNILVLTAIIKSRRLHTTSNIYICALVLADIFISFIHSVEYVLKGVDVDISYLSCGVVVSMGILGFFTNLMMIEIISIDRFFAIYWPFHFFRAIKISVVAPVLSAGLGGLIFISQPVKEYTSCWYGKVLTVPLVTVMTVITCCAALELTVMYGAMFYKAIKQQKDLSVGYFNRNNKDMTIFDIKALKVCSVVLGAFLATWFPPLLVFNLAAHASQEKYSLAYSVCFMLSAINSALDPLVYSIMRKDIREGIRRLFYKTDHHVFTRVQCD